MATSTTKMTRTECETLLKEVHVGIVCVAEEERGPLAVPVWYDYDPQKGVWFVTGKQSRKARLIDQAGRISLCVQMENPPYKYVSVEGPVTAVTQMDRENDLRPLARRYLGIEEGDRYTESMNEDPDDASITICMLPERWYSADYSR